MSAENPDRDWGDEILASAAAEKLDEATRKQNQAEFACRLLTARMKTLANRIGHSAIKIQSDDEMVMGKAETNDAVKAFLALQEEFGRLDAKKLKSLEQLEKLEARLARLEAIFDSPEKN